MTIRRQITLLLVLGLLTGCGGGDTNDGDGSSGSASVEKLRFSGIPDRDKDKITKQYSVVTDYLSGELGIPVEFVHASDYTAAVTSLAANKVDLVWLGGATSVQAEERTDGEVTFVATRKDDLTFQSYFIANASLGIEPVDDLAELAAELADHTFTFGSKSSTSGHIMPRHFMNEAGIFPEEEDVKGGPKYQLQGGHSATLEAVASGAVDFGALNYKVWEGASDATKEKAPVVYETPPYVDYCMVAHNRIGQDLIGKIREAFVKLDASNPDHAPVLEAFGAETFVAAKPEDWDGIRSVLASAAVKKILQ